MIHSPITKTIYPPITNLDEYDEVVQDYKFQYENCDFDEYRAVDLIDRGRDLVDHCRFLDEKLMIKRQKIERLEMQNTSMKERLAKMEDDMGDKVNEIDALKAKLKAYTKDLQAELPAEHTEKEPTKVDNKLNEVPQTWVHVGRHMVP